jgi:hypothetical protein
LSTPDRSEALAPPTQQTRHDGRVRVPSWRRGQDGTTTGTSVKLRNRWYAPRKARVELDNGKLMIVLPGYFGSRPWEIPLGDVAACDLTEADFSHSDDVVFPDGVAIPYFATTRAAVMPNVELLFRQRRKVPPLRAIPALSPNADLPFGYLESRSEAGGQVDGLMLLSADPAAALTQLVAAGAEQVRDPVLWLRDHRRAVDDPAERAELLKGERINRWQVRVSGALLFGDLLVASALLASRLAPWWAWVLVAIDGGAGLALRRKAHR